MPPKRARADAGSTSAPPKRVRKKAEKLLPSSSDLLTKEAFDYPALVDGTRKSVAFLPLPIIRELLRTASLLYKDTIHQFLIDRAHHHLSEFQNKPSWMTRVLPTAKNLTYTWENEDDEPDYTASLAFLIPSAGKSLGWTWENAYIDPDGFTERLPEEMIRDCLTLAAENHEGMWRVVTQKESQERERKQREEILEFEDKVQECIKILEECTSLHDDKEMQDDANERLLTNLSTTTTSISEEVYPHSHPTTLENALSSLCEIGRTILIRELPSLKDPNVFTKELQQAINDISRMIYHNPTKGLSRRERSEVHRHIEDTAYLWHGRGFSSFPGRMERRVVCVELEEVWF